MKLVMECKVHYELRTEFINLSARYFNNKLNSDVAQKCSGIKRLRVTTWPAKPRSNNASHTLV